MTTPSLPEAADARSAPPPSAPAEEALLVLRQAVTEALDRKRRLGHYAVVWQDDRVVELPPQALPSLATDEAEK